MADQHLPSVSCRGTNVVAVLAGLGETQDFFKSENGYFLENNYSNKKIPNSSAPFKNGVNMPCGNENFVFIA